MHVCDNSNFLEEHSFKNHCCYPYGINFSLKCSPRGMAVPQRVWEGPAGLLNLATSFSLDFCLNIGRKMTEISYAVVCCWLVCCEVVTQPCSSLSMELT